MLDIENYDKWKAVCDDDDLIQMMYDEGIRPGDERFNELLGVPSMGKKMGVKEVACILGAIGVTIIVINGTVFVIERGLKGLNNALRKAYKKFKKKESK